MKMLNELKNKGLHRYVDFFPVARTLKRKFIAYLGPTNSGKTYRSFAHLKDANTGVYLAPLRLLALEGKETLQEHGRPCNLITGEEKVIVPDATLTASTIEMLNVTEEVDVVVIDEVQMIADEERGWAWTRAIIGAPAQTVVLAGSADSLPLLKKLITDILGDELEVHTTERLSALEIERKSARLERLEPFTAIVAFSRKDVMTLKPRLEKMGHKVSVVYGALSPEVRRAEAERFRKGETDVLVATDAIGLGLNLPIRRMLFWSTTKWNGKEVIDVSDSHVKQIAGRAGRWGQFPKGFVGAFDNKDVKFINKALQTTLQPLDTTAFVMPALEHLEAIQSGCGSDKLEILLRHFVESVKFESKHLQPFVSDETLETARRIDGYDKLDLEDKYNFMTAPVDDASALCDEHFWRWVSAFEKRKPIYFPVDKDDCADMRNISLIQAEHYVKLCTLYLWLGQKYPLDFNEEDTVKYIREQMNNRILFLLRKSERR